VQHVALRSGAIVHLSSNVAGLEHTPSGTYRLLVNGTHREYDIVIVACPVGALGFVSPLLPPVTEYQLTYVTFVEGTPSHRYFGQSPIPDVVLTTERPEVDFLSIGRMVTAQGRHFKIFTRAPAYPELLGRMFSDYNETTVVRRVFAAYPKYSVPAPRPAFKLADGLFHVNAVELLASAIEMSLIGGKNVALLAARHLVRSAAAEARRKGRDEL
jgi:prenylcysteine oxidase/farnesylcysteine lyase